MPNVCKSQTWDFILKVPGFLKIYEYIQRRQKISEDISNISHNMFTTFPLKIGEKVYIPSLKWTFLSLLVQVYIFLKIVSI